MNTLDHLVAAVQQCQTYGPIEARRYFCRDMTSDDKQAFDLFLVKMGDQLAWQPGTTESRFVERVRRMSVDITPNPTPDDVADHMDPTSVFN